MKLYKITLKGMTYSVTGTIYGYSYVVATDPTEALKKVQDYLKEKDLGFSHERELDTIELLAEQSDYPKCRTILYL